MAYVIVILDVIKLNKYLLEKKHKVFQVFKKKIERSIMEKLWYSYYLNNFFIFIKF